MTNAKEVKNRIMSNIILASLDTQDSEDMITPAEGEAFNELPFAYQVISKKLTAFEIKFKFSHLATMLISLYSENNPGMVQLLALEAIEYVVSKGGDRVTVDDLVDLYPINVPSPRDDKFRESWDGQKVFIEKSKESFNAVDAPAIWIYVAHDKMSIKDGVAKIVKDMESALS